MKKRVLLVLFLVGAANSFARDEWFRGLDLEPALGEASLVLAGRVVDVSETKIMMGGKAESALLQFKFTPAVVLKISPTLEQVAFARASRRSAELLAFTKSCILSRLSSGCPLRVVGDLASASAAGTSASSAWTHRRIRG